MYLPSDIIPTTSTPYTTSHAHTTYLTLAIPPPPYLLSFFLQNLLLVSLLLHYWFVFCYWIHLMVGFILNSSIPYLHSFLESHLGYLLPRPTPYSYAPLHSKYENIIESYLCSTICTTSLSQWKSLKHFYLNSNTGMYLSSNFCSQRLYRWYSLRLSILISTTFFIWGSYLRSTLWSQLIFKCLFRGIVTPILKVVPGTLKVFTQ